MGLITSRRASRGDVVDASNNNAYKYPPKTGSYFGSYFIMGGTRFESTQPDSYLFGENKDLNFLGNKPTPFPYPAPQAHEPTRTLKSLVNIRKDSLKFVKESEQDDITVQDSTSSSSPSIETSSTRYNIEFTFDTDTKCAITIYYFASEEIVNKAIVYRPRDPAMNSETFHYKRGANQVFCQPTHFIDPSQFSEEEWQYSVEKDVIPIVIHCVVEEEEHVGHSHMTLAVVDKCADGSYSLKPYKQKQIVDGLCYLLQEIYGIENKNTERAKLDEDFDDNGSECVICMSETRDTLILPCRHLCLCNGCADNLRYQANNCPICRAKFRALLQLRAIRKKPTGPAANSRRQPVEQGTDEPTLSQEGVPAGYEAVSLIEALNGPTLPQCAVNVPTLSADATLQSFSQANANGDAVHEATQESPESRDDGSSLADRKFDTCSDVDSETREDDGHVVVTLGTSSALLVDRKGETRSHKGSGAHAHQKQKKKTCRNERDTHGGTDRKSAEVSSGRKLAVMASGGVEKSVCDGKEEDAEEEEEEEEEYSFCEDTLSKDPETGSSVSLEIISETNQVPSVHARGASQRSGNKISASDDKKDVNVDDDEERNDDNDDSSDDLNVTSVTSDPLMDRVSSPTSSLDVQYQGPTESPPRPVTTDPLGHLDAPLALMIPAGGCESHYSSTSSSKELLDSSSTSEHKMEPEYV